MKSDGGGAQRATSVSTGRSGARISGTASAAVYQAALQTVLYDNTNPNAYAGVRQVSLTVHDDAATADRHVRLRPLRNRFSCDEELNHARLE